VHTNKQSIDPIDEQVMKKKLALFFGMGATAARISGTILAILESKPRWRL
jgi:hypothetical protein